MTQNTNNSSNLNPAQQLINYGQSIWYDNISRDILESGELKRLINEWGVRGLTSNPSIFEKAIGSSNIYDKDVAKFKAQSFSSDKIFEELAISDLGEAADLFKDIYKTSGGDDGFVSIEVSPLLATDTAGTIEEAKRLYGSLDRDNIMVKIPGTKEGLPAIKKVLEEGINVNVTLLFSVENYLEVAEAYVSALESRAEKGLPIDKIRSVASFFVSRVDVAVDNALNSILESGSSSSEAKSLAQTLIGKFGIANSQLAYLEFEKLFGSERFQKLAEKGAKSQRPLWASTGTKNPDYSDVLYVDKLIGKETVNTLPPKTLAAFVDHGNARDTIKEEIEFAKTAPQKLSELGVDVPKILTELQEKGVQQFVDSFNSLNKTIEEQ